MEVVRSDQDGGAQTTLMAPFNAIAWMTANPGSILAEPEAQRARVELKGNAITLTLRHRRAVL
jgi:hypothetical protein